MKTRRFAKALVGVVAAAAAVGLLGLPASAITAELTGGTLDIFASDSTVYSTQDLTPGTGTGTSCSPGSGHVTTINSTNGGFTATFTSNTSAMIGGTHFTVVMTINLSGTISTTGVVSATGSATALLYANGSTCGTTGNLCTLTVSNIALAGTSTITDHVVEVSDTVTVSGSTGDHGAFEFNVVATGNCGALSAVDDGSVTATDVELHITSLSTG